MPSLAIQTSSGSATGSSPMILQYWLMSSVFGSKSSSSSSRICGSYDGFSKKRKMISIQKRMTRKRTKMRMTVMRIQMNQKKLRSRKKKLMQHPKEISQFPRRERKLKHQHHN
jgi:hypothetical protein